MSRIFVDPAIGFSVNEFFGLVAYIELNRTSTATAAALLVRQ
ncbi:hypothetical protein HMPREF0294_1594 [Corynebacterium glucuronolyticum ATCC 51867]|nr:hypothetical protein HMPREF0294_1594 [Corynebacterium glucuronolyticum ATCC 51867]